MRFIIPLCFLLIWAGTTGCFSSSQSRVRPHPPVKPAPPVRGETLERSSKSRPGADSGSFGRPETPAPGSRNDFASGPSRAKGTRAPGVRVPAHWPTLVNPGDGSFMVLVQSGEYLIGMLDPARGTVRSNEPSSHFEKLGAFYIDRTEVTVEQFRKFDPDYDETPHTGGRECPACPAMGIDWASAGRYCLWAGKRLPTEAEWEAAARGQDRTPWPWGAEFDPTRANLLGERDGFLAAAPVGSFPQGSSPSGVLDMVGNVWEWVRTPFTPQTPRADSGDRSPLRIGKGGGWTSRSEHARISFRNIVDPKIKNPTFGFRCVKPAMGFKKVRPNS